jgi:exosome complex component RRP45
VIDPSLKEEAASSGGMTVTINPHGELCAVQKARGVGLAPSEIMRCVRLAGQQVRCRRGRLCIGTGAG